MTFDFDHSYSLGDMVTFAIDNRDCPKGSIGEQYIEMSNKKPQQYEILQSIVNKYNKGICPGAAEIVMHLRVGNVVENDSKSVDELLSKPCIADGDRLSKQIYVRPLEYHTLLQTAYKKKMLSRLTIICGGHMCTNTTKSKEYVNKIKESWENSGYNVRVSIGNDADDDFVYMCRSKYFIRSGGGFSAHVQTVRVLNGTNEGDFPFADYRVGDISSYEQLIEDIMSSTSPNATASNRHSLGAEEPSS